MSGPRPLPSLDTSTSSPVISLVCPKVSSASLPKSVPVSPSARAPPASWPRGQNLRIVEPPLTPSALLQHFAQSWPSVCDVLGRVHFSPSFASPSFLLHLLSPDLEAVSSFDLCPQPCAPCSSREGSSWQHVQPHHSPAQNLSTAPHCPQDEISSSA